MKENMTTTFFSALAQRKNKENDLSDVTWAFCQSSEAFRKAFILFFFPNWDEKSFESIDREISEDGSRVDFYVTCKDENDYLIECKINDMNQHFGQYEKAYHVSKDRLGYITNYPLHEEGYTVRQWEEWYDRVKSLTSQQPSDDIPMWEGYTEYLRNVCYITKITKTMKLEDMYSLFVFQTMVNKLISNGSTERFHWANYGSKGRNIWGDNFGKYFAVEYNDGVIETTWGALTVWFDREHPVICTGFENMEGWGQPVCKVIKDKATINALSLNTCKAYYEGNVLWFEMTPEKQEELNNASSPDEQSNILRDYFEEVLAAPLQFTNK